MLTETTTSTSSTTPVVALVATIAVVDVTDVVVAAAYAATAYAVALMFSMLEDRAATSRALGGAADHGGLVSH